MEAAEKQILKMNLLAKLDFLPGATALVREVTSKLGLTDKDSRRMELVVEEACLNVIEHAFEGSEAGDYDISILRRPGQIVVAVEDRGLPFDIKKYEVAGESGLGTVLMKAFADEVHFLNQGRRGKRVELIKNLPDMDLNVLVKEASVQPAPLNLKDEEITIRLMRPDEAVSLARCAYRCYGYTYASDHFYFPERVREMVQSGTMISTVAVTPDNEIVGHLAVVRDTPTSLVGESGQAIVDPRCRGNGIHKRMGFFLADQVKAAGMLGLFGEAVTVHPYSQKSALARGFIETGVLLGFVPATMNFKSIQGQEDRKRFPVVLYYKRLNDEPVRDVYLPVHHAGILRHIYDSSHLRRNIIAINDYNALALPERAQVDVNVRTEVSWAFLQVKEYGRDLENLVKFRLKELCQKRLDVIYLDLPISHPAVQYYCAALEMLGFFFGGIVPEVVPNGDILRLQYINNADIELNNVQIATDFSKEVFQYVVKASGIAV